MPLARLLAVVLLLSSIPAIGQAQQSQSNTARDNSVLAAKDSIVAPDQSLNVAGTQDALKHLADGKRQIRLDVREPALLADSGEKFLVIPMPDDGFGLADDVSCLSIRSYVVARDEKDSDATHLVKYSTCQPTSRYRLKTAVATVRDKADE